MWWQALPGSGDRQPLEDLADRAAQDVIGDLVGFACSMVKRGLGLAVVDPFTAWANRDPSIVFRPFLPQIPCRFALLEPDTRTPTVLATELIGHAETLRDEVLAGMG